MDLTELKASQTAKITQIDGGLGMTKKTHAMGLVPGVTVKKISDQFMRGPVIILVGQTRLAIGFGMAKRIYVSVNSK